MPTREHMGPAAEEPGGLDSCHLWTTEEMGRVGTSLGIGSWRGDPLGDVVDVDAGVVASSTARGGQIVNQSQVLVVTFVNNLSQSSGHRS